MLYRDLGSERGDRVARLFWPKTNKMLHVRHSVLSARLNVYYKREPRARSGIRERIQQIYAIIAHVCGTIRGGTDL